MSGSRVLIVAFVLAAVATCSWGIAPARAGQGAGPAPQASDQAALGKKLSDADAAAARAARDAAWQKRKQMREFVEQIGKGQQPPAVPENAGKEGAK